MQSWYRHIGSYLHLGFQFTIAICVGVGVGYWLDTRLNTLPLLLIVGLLLGGCAGFLMLYRSVYPHHDQENNEKN